MIFDNAHEDVLMDKDWPQGSQGSLLVTTRSSEFNRIFGTKSLALGPIDEPSATNILLASVNQATLPEGDLEQAAKICDMMGHWPLALSQISGYISESGCSLSRFIETYHDFESHQRVHRASFADSTTKYSNTIDTVFMMSTKVLEKRCKESLLTLFLVVFLSRDGKVLLVTYTIVQD